MRKHPTLTRGPMTTTPISISSLKDVAEEEGEGGRVRVGGVREEEGGKIRRHGVVIKCRGG